MHTYNKLLIVVAVALLVGGVYMYFSNGLSVQAADSSSSLVSSNTSSSSNGNAVTGTGDQQIAEDTAFLETLTSLTKINIDPSLFSDKSFQALNDNTVVLEQVTPGRPNPFAPIDTTGGAVVVSPVITNDATQITARTAILNGATSNLQGVTSTYFEYGPTPTLGRVTPPVSQSLIGSFVSNISGLTSGTTYFYRAAAKANGSILYGDVVSFTTN